MSSEMKVFEIKHQMVDKFVSWESKKAFTQVALDEKEVIQFCAWAMHLNPKIDEVRYNYQGSTQGHYITRQMAARITSEQMDLINAMDRERLNMLCMVLVDAIETAATDNWTTHVAYGYKEDDDGMMTFAWANITIWGPNDPFDGRRFCLTPLTLDQGIRAIVDNPKFEISRDLWKDISYADRHPEDADLDADAAECLIQAAIFGELIYG